MLNATLDMMILFIASFLAATIVPAQSEAVLAGMHLTGHYNIYQLLFIATLGNVLGSCLNWLLGRYLSYFKTYRWFPVKEEALTRATHTYQRFGIWTLLLAWVPIIGDPLTIIAGFLRTPLPIFLVLITIGKAARYAAVLSVF